MFFSLCIKKLPSAPDECFLYSKPDFEIQLYLILFDPWTFKGGSSAPSPPHLNLSFFCFLFLHFLVCIFLHTFTFTLHEIFRLFIHTETVKLSNLKGTSGLGFWSFIFQMVIFYQMSLIPPPPPTPASRSKISVSAPELNKLNSYFSKLPKITNIYISQLEWEDRGPFHYLKGVTQCNEE